jgi:hypothetical protein
MKQFLLANAFNLGLGAVLAACTADPAYIGRDGSAGHGGAGGGTSVSGATGLSDGSGGALQTTGGAASALGGGATTGGAGGTSNACAVVATSAAPYVTKLRFTNNGTAPVWLWNGCTLDFDLTSCIDGYAKPQPISVFCMQECIAGVTPLCVTCGMCLVAGKQVPRGGYVDYDWDGLLRDAEQRPGQCSCYNARAAEAGLYRVSVPVWTADPAPQGSSTGVPPEPNYRVTTDFALSEAGSTIGVEVGSQTCTFGADQTCNDRLEVSALWGKCLADGTCECNVGFVINPSTGRCTESCPNRERELFSGQECVSDVDCGQNERCAGCFASICQCTGTAWGCTADCRYKCVPL